MKQGDQVRYLPTGGYGVIERFIYYCKVCSKQIDSNKQLDTFCCGEFEEYLWINWDTALLRNGQYISSEFEKVYTIDDFEIGDEAEVVVNTLGISLGTKGKIVGKELGSININTWYLLIDWAKNNLRKNGQRYKPKIFKSVNKKLEKEFKVGDKVVLNQSTSLSSVAKYSGERGIVKEVAPKNFTDNYITVQWENIKVFSESTLHIKYFNLIEDSKEDFPCEQKCKKEKSETINNQGRIECIVCEGPLKKVPSGFSGGKFYDVCPKCELGEYYV